MYQVYIKSSVTAEKGVEVSKFQPNSVVSASDRDPFASVIEVLLSVSGPPF